MGKKKRRNNGPRIYWRNGRAYADLRAYADVGGGREALSEPGATWGTTDAEIAEALFSDRLAELQAKRASRVGVEPRRSTTLAELVAEHLVKKAKAGETSHKHMEDLEHRLRVALDFFGRGRDPRSIEPAEVGKWSEHLGKSGTRNAGTRRHYLNALSGLYRRAQELLYVDPDYNPVVMLVEKPTGTRRDEAHSFEVPEAALILEAARIVDGRTRRGGAAPGLYPIVATFLLTGGRWSGVMGLDVEDVSFEQGIVRFRPNEHRNLKTMTSRRVVPLWPQLRDILQEWMYGGERPRVSGLLFPAEHGGMVGDLRKSFDLIGKMAGIAEGEVRSKVLRHTYCSARLQTVQRIVKPGKDPATDPDPYEYVQVSHFTVAKEMGHGGLKLVERIYGHAPRHPHRSETVEYRVEQHREQLAPRLAELQAAAQAVGPAAS